jgi:alpha-ketoglutarate-dependent 2,4-dichlorophenoxyacetate dioxygenase
MGERAASLAQLVCLAARLHALTRCDSISKRPRILCREATTMAATIYPVTPSFAAEVGDIDLSRQIEPVDLAAVNKAFAEYAVLIFPDQHLSQDQHLDFTKHFGPLETTIALYRKGEALRVRQEFADVSNLNYENNVLGEESRQRLFQLGNRLWHTDSSFKRLPARASLLYARSIPPIGGHTEFADERAAYDALPEETKRRLDSLVAEHSIFNSRARLGFTNFSDEERYRECRPCRR